MKTSILFLLLIVSCSLPAQEKILFTLNPGSSLYTSENSSKVIGKKEINFINGGSIGYESPDLFGMNMRIIYDLAFARVNDIQTFTVASEKTPEPIATIGADYLLYLNSVDLAVPLEVNGVLTLWIGPSASWGNRSIIIDGLSWNSEELNAKTRFEDRLATLCAGLNCSISMETPLTDGPSHLFFFAALKMRYLASVWVDARGRNVENYQQQFLTGQFNLGLGYTL
jgi:hypothetical protein